MEARQELIDELDEQHALFALEAPAHAAALWSIGQIEAFYEAGGELLGPEPDDPVPRPLPLLTLVPCVLLLLCCYPCVCDSVAVLSAASSGDPETTQCPALTDAWPSTFLALTAHPPVLTDAAASTLLAPTAYSPMLTDATASTLLAATAPPPVPHAHPIRPSCRCVICVCYCCVLSVPLLRCPLLVLLLCPLPLLLPRPLLSTPPPAHPTAVPMCVPVALCRLHLQIAQVGSS